MKYSNRENLAYLFRTMKSVEKFGLKFVSAMILLIVFVRYGLMFWWDIKINFTEVWGDILLISVIASCKTLFRALVVIGELRERMDKVEVRTQLKEI